MAGKFNNALVAQRIYEEALLASTPKALRERARVNEQQRQRDLFEDKRKRAEASRLAFISRSNWTMRNYSRLSRVYV